jgi:hypothetical protein
MEVAPQVDLFATAANAKLPLFFSPMGEQGMQSRNALEIQWKGLPYIHPPIPLIGRCLRKILLENASALVVAPHWSGQSWSVLLNKMAKRQMVIGKSEEILLPGNQMTQKGDKLPPGFLAAYLLRPPYSI